MRNPLIIRKSQVLPAKRLNMTESVFRVSDGCFVVVFRVFVVSKCVYVVVMAGSAPFFLGNFTVVILCLFAVVRHLFMVFACLCSHFESLIILSLSATELFRNPSTQNASFYASESESLKR